MISAGTGHDESLDKVKLGFRNGIVTKDEYEGKLRAYHNSQLEVKSDTRDKVDRRVASDCIYNPTYHTSLLESASSAMDINSLFIVGYSLHGNVQSSQILNFFNIAQDEFGLKVVNEFTKEYDGQKGIGSTDKERGTVYIKLLRYR